LARNQNKMSEWSDMSTRGLLFQWASTIKTQRVGLEQSGSHWKLTYSRHNIAENCWIGVKQQSLTYLSNDLKTFYWIYWCNFNSINWCQ
jgi:hypothetical protein